MSICLLNTMHDYRFSLRSLWESDLCIDVCRCIHFFTASLAQWLRGVPLTASQLCRLTSGGAEQCPSRSMMGSASCLGCGRFHCHAVGTGARLPAGIPGVWSLLRSLARSPPFLLQSQQQPRGPPCTSDPPWGPLVHLWPSWGCAGRMGCLGPAGRSPHERCFTLVTPAGPFATWSRVHRLSVEQAVFWSHLLIWILWKINEFDNFPHKVYCKLRKR